MSSMILKTVEFSQFLFPIVRETSYLDPGSGSFILQLLIASAVGLAFAFRSSLAKIKNN